MKKGKLISRQVLTTELSMAMKMIEMHNFGYAGDTIAHVLSRIKFYDMKVERTPGVNIKEGWVTVGGKER